MAVVVMTGCEKSGGDDDPEYSDIVTFESAELLTGTGGLPYTFNNILWGAEAAEEGDHGLWYDGIIYSESGVNFGNFYTDYAGYYDTWGGFAISSNNNLLDITYANQFSVYASSASKFAIAYDQGGYNGAQYERPVITFDAPRSVISARVANAVMTYAYATANPNGSKEEEPLWFAVEATGYNGENLAGTLEIKLVDGGVPVSGWREVDFSALGEVDKITFTTDCNDKNDYGNLVPAYFCIDDIKLK